MPAALNGVGAPFSAPGIPPAYLSPHLGGGYRGGGWGCGGRCRLHAAAERATHAIEPDTLTSGKGVGFNGVRARKEVLGKRGARAACAPAKSSGAVKIA